MGISVFQSLAFLWSLLTTVEPIIDGVGVLNPSAIGEAVAFIDNGVETKLDYRFCTGALITRTLVLTAAFCCQTKSLETRVRLGSYNYYSFEDGLLFTPRNHRIIQMGLNPHDPRSVYWQLCILQLFQPVPFHIVPLQLPLRSDTVHTTEHGVYGFGFGSLRENDKWVTKKLQMLLLPSVFKEVCTTTYKDFIKTSPKLNLSPYPCYGYVEGRSKMVEFDAGGPIIDIEQRRLRAISLSNIPSERSQANGYPTFAADVAYFRPEIDKVIKELNLS